MNKKIYLVRHGKIIWDKEKAYIGQIDLALAPEGRAQSLGLKEWFGGVPLDQAYCSPLIRCVNTLDGLLEGRNIPWATVAELQEISMGDWEGQSFLEIRTRYPQAYDERGREIDRFAPPGGESFFELQQRVMPAFEKIVKTGGKNQLLVLHAGVIRVILSGILGISLKNLFKWPISYGGVYEVDYDPQKEKWTCIHKK
jgi:probable phosphoglycerate mutase